MRIVLSLFLFFSLNILLFAQETSAKPLIAPGGLTVIPPNIDYESVANRADITDLLPLLTKPDPDLERQVPFDPEIWAKDVRYSRDIWCLQFSFKPLRMIDVDMPNLNGNYDKKKVWYLVYSVKNLGPANLGEKKINSILGSDVPAGSEMKLPVPEDTTTINMPRAAPLEVRQETGQFAPSPGKSTSICFVPQFVLATPREAEDKAVSYNDRILPLALSAIVKREGMKGLPETSVTFPQKEIAEGEELWGVAMWTDVDPRIHEFSIYVSGLTNAYQWTDKPTADGTEPSGKIGEGRVLKRRVLKIDWWRVGDHNSISESQIHYGSKDVIMPMSIFDVDGDANRDGKVDADERKRFEEIVQEADANKDGWVDGAEKVEYHRIHQHWLQPSYGYEWLFL